MIIKECLGRPPGVKSSLVILRVKIHNITNDKANVDESLRFISTSQNDIDMFPCLLKELCLIPAEASLTLNIRVIPAILRDFNPLYCPYRRLWVKE